MLQSKDSQCIVTQIAAIQCSQLKEMPVLYDSDDREHLEGAGRPQASHCLNRLLLRSQRSIKAFKLIPFSHPQELFTHTHTF